MATPQQAVIFSLVVLLLSSIAHGGGAVRHLHYSVVPTSLLLEPESFCSGLKAAPPATGTWVPLHRPFGPCSSSSSRTTPPPSLTELLRWDQERTEYVRRKATGTAGDVLNPDKPRVQMVQTDYMPRASFGIGSGYGGDSGAIIDADGDGDAMVPSQTMAVDTTVDVPWIQCVPCPVPQCYPQRNAMFDPSRSPTAAAVRCGSRACRSLGPYANGCTSNSTCQYLIEYSDDRATAGTYMTDTLTISSSTTVPNFRFGCSHAVRGKFSDQTAGTMSLGGGAQSLRAQTARGLGNAFSYCVPPPSASGFLSLGGPATSSNSTSRRLFATTPLIRSAVNPSLYLVRLQGIVVAGQRLRVPPAVFSTGAVMDSSAVVTQLPPTAYRALRRAFRSAMTAYPTSGPIGNLDTCYDFIGVTNVTVPAVSLVFGGGAVVVLAPPAVMLSGCLAFTPTATDLSLGFIGNVQQQSHEVLYDVAAGAVGFRRGAC